MGYLVAAILVMAPLILTPSVLFYFDVTPKAVVALWGAAAVLPWVAGTGLRGLRSTRHGRWFCALLACSALWTVLSSVFSERPELSWLGSNWRRFGVPEQLAVTILAAAAGEAAARGAMRLMLRAMACGGAAMAAYGILQYFGWDPWLPSAAYHVGEGEWTIVRPPGTLGHAAYFANWLLFGLFAGVALWLVEERRAWRAAGAAAAAAAAATIVLTGTRAGIIGMAAGAAVLCLWLRLRLSRRAAAVLAVSAIAAGAFYYSPAGLRLRARTRWYVEDAWGGARLLMWRDSARLASRHPVWGAGPEAFSRVFPRVQSRELAAAYPDFYHESPHNLFLDAATGSGLPAALAMAGLCAAALVAARRFSVRDARISGALAAACCAAVVAHQFSVLTVATALGFYTLLALTAALGAKAPPMPRHRGAQLAVVPAALALLVWGGWLAAADRRQFETRAALHAGKFGDAMALAAGAAQPFDWLWYSRALPAAMEKTQDQAVRADARQAALAAALRAAEVSENPQTAWYQAAILSAAMHDAAGTERALRNAIAAAPNWFKPHWALARLLHMAGRREESLAEASLAAQLNPKDREVADTLAAIR
jgi:O-antigen ligase